MARHAHTYYELVSWRQPQHLGDRDRILGANWLAGLAESPNPVLQWKILQIQGGEGSRKTPDINVWRPHTCGPASTHARAYRQVHTFTHRTRKLRRAKGCLCGFETVKMVTGKEAKVKGNTWKESSVTDEVQVVVILRCSWKYKGTSMISCSGTGSSEHSQCAWDRTTTTKIKTRAREMAQGLTLRADIEAYNCNSSSRSDTSFDFCGHQPYKWCTDIHTGKTFTHINNS